MEISKKKRRTIFLNITSSSKLFLLLFLLVYRSPIRKPCSNNVFALSFPPLGLLFFILSQHHKTKGLFKPCWFINNVSDSYSVATKTTRHHIRLITKRANETTQSWRERRLRDKIQLLRAVLPYGWAAFKQVHQKQKYMHPRLHVGMGQLDTQRTGRTWPRSFSADSGKQSAHVEAKK
jgi:hypothetical protein